LDDITYFWENNYDPETKCLDMELVFFVRQDGVYTRFDETHMQKAYTVNELTALLKEWGFNTVETYDNYTENEVTETTERITFVARKA
jgi:hypothetical protein